MHFKSQISPYIFMSKLESQRIGCFYGDQLFETMTLSLPFPSIYRTLAILSNIHTRPGHTQSSKLLSHLSTMGEASRYLLPFLQHRSWTIVAVFLILFTLSDSILHVHGQRPKQHIPMASKFHTMKFYDVYSNLWGSQHQLVSEDQSSTTIWLDRSSGYYFGYSFID